MNIIRENLSLSIKPILNSWCIPQTVPKRVESLVSQAKVSEIKPSLNGLFRYTLSQDFKLKNILSNSTWIEQDIYTLAKPYFNDLPLMSNKLALGLAFDKKYGYLSPFDDARSVAEEGWRSDIKRALSHVNPKALGGTLLHVGSDSYFEPPILHSTAKSVVLIDIANKLLHRAVAVSPAAKTIHTRAEHLSEITEKSIDLYVALRVFSSVGFDTVSAIKEAARVLRFGGSILLSISNGYRGIDNTILPGQVQGTPPYLDFTRPFEDAIDLLISLYTSGFRELFFVPGNTELYIGGTYLPTEKHANYSEIILHTEPISQIPLCFYSSSMPTFWLGNYSDHPVKIDGVVWPTVEHFFQSQKFLRQDFQQSVLNTPSPEEAKSFAWYHDSDVREDWLVKRTAVMRKALHAKFNQHHNLRHGLVVTENRELIERSQDDTFWGRSLFDEGANNMGAILMELRTFFRKGKRNED